MACRSTHLKLHLEPLLRRPRIRGGCGRGGVGGGLELEVGEVGRGGEGGGGFLGHAECFFDALEVGYLEEVRLRRVVIPSCDFLSSFSIDERW